MIKITYLIEEGLCYFISTAVQNIFIYVLLFDW